MSSWLKFSLSLAVSLSAFGASAKTDVIYCGSLDFFRPNSDYLNIVAEIVDATKLKIKAYSAGNVYALEAELEGRPYRVETDRDVQGEHTFQKFSWPQEALVWKSSGEAPVAKKTFLLLPRRLDAIPRVSKNDGLVFVGHLKDNGKNVMLTCFIETLD